MICSQQILICPELYIHMCVYVFIIYSRYTRYIAKESDFLFALFTSSCIYTSCLYIYCKFMEYLDITIYYRTIWINKDSLDKI